MFITSGDFSIKAENFDLTKGWNILRIICGAFMFPHIAGKFAGGALAAGTVSFFAKAGFNPPELWVYLAAAAEGVSGIALILGICTRFAALGAAAVLGVAVYVLQVVKGFGWTWNTGGSVSGFLGHRLRGRRHRGVEVVPHYTVSGQRARGHGARLGIDPQPRSSPCLGHVAK